MLFRLSNVFKSYGSQDVLRGTSLQINPGEHVGLVGRNGAGKTTIFRLVNGEASPDRGDVVRARELKLGLLTQHVHFEKGSTVHESALSAFGRLQQIEHEMHELEHQMAEAGDDLDKILARYSDLQHQYEREGGFEYSARAEAILQGLGFDRTRGPGESLPPWLNIRTRLRVRTDVEGRCSARESCRDHLRLRPFDVRAHASRVRSAEGGQTQTARIHEPLIPFRNERAGSAGPI